MNTPCTCNTSVSSTCKYWRNLLCSRKKQDWNVARMKIGRVKLFSLMNPPDCLSADESFYWFCVVPAERNPDIVQVRRSFSIKEWGSSQFCILETREGSIERLFFHYSFAIIASACSSWTNLSVAVANLVGAHRLRYLQEKGLASLETDP